MYLLLMLDINLCWNLEEMAPIIPHDIVKADVIVWYIRLP